MFDWLGCQHWPKCGMFIFFWLGWHVCVHVSIKRRKKKKSVSKHSRIDKRACRVVCCRCYCEMRETLVPSMLSRTKDKKENRKELGCACVHVCASSHFAQCALSTLSRVNEEARVEKAEKFTSHSHSFTTTTTGLSTSRNSQNEFCDKAAK